MNRPAKNDYIQALGQRVLSEANDIKRTPEALADELGFERQLIRDVIDGKCDLTTIEEVIQRMSTVYPIPFHDIWIERDDTDEGLLIMRAEDSKASGRVFERADRNGNPSPYYEYRDTVMSRLAPYRPEWIREIRTVKDNDPNNPDVIYNHGHLMHQFALFVGPVNFYWEANGKKFCGTMNTGDSNYITPFVPHSYTSRDPNETAFIVAVTFGGDARMALDDFGRLKADDAERLSGDLRNPSVAFKARLGRHLAAESICEKVLVDLLVDEGMGGKEAALAVFDGRPERDQIAVIAGVLNIRESDLLVTAMTEDEEILLQNLNDVPSRNYPDDNEPAYRLTPMVRHRHQPHLKAFQCEVLGDQPANAIVQHGLHEYVYNFGDAPVTVSWNENRSATLNPGDSAYVRPMISHGFSRLSPESGEGRILLVRIPGRLNDGAMNELASFAPVRRNRILGETTRWF
jgi:hypothetical protein